MPPKRKISALWNHFNEVEEKKKAKCCYCDKVIAIFASSIGSLSRHMKAVHPTVPIERQSERCEDYVGESAMAAASATTQTSASTIAEPNTITFPAARGTTMRTAHCPPPSMRDYVNIKKPLPTNKIEILDEQLVKMISKGYHALRIVEEKEFKKFVELLNPGYTLPTRKTLSESLLPMFYNKLFEKTKEKISKASAIAITTDAWTSVTNDGYIAITAHFIEEDINKLCTVMIGCVQFEEKHTSENLKLFLEEKFREWNIHRLIGVVVTDNAANILGAVRLGGWRSIGCFAHSLNLVVQAGLVTSINETITKVKKIVEYFHRSPPGTNKLKEIQLQMGLTQLKLKNDVATRWNSTYDMLERIYKTKNAVISTIALLRPDLALSQNDWEIIKKSLPILKIFDEVTRDISGENYVSASKFIVYCKLIRKKIDQFEDLQLVEVVELLNCMKTQLRQRFGGVENNMLLCEATILDPRFRRNGFYDMRNYDRAAANLKLKIGEIQHNTAAALPTQRPAESITDSIWNDFDVEITNLIPENPTAAGIIEFDKYIQEPIIIRTENPLLWWNERKAVYPRLYKYMLKRLNIPATSVPCERIFSKAGLTLTDRRTRLKTQKLSQLLFIGCNTP